MIRNTKIVKKIAALFLVLLLSIDSLAAVVSDNDGSAFITKAEFDSLKNDFQSQIDQYNSSIDSKIDIAIATYLSGLTVETKSTKTFYDGLGEKVLIIDSSKINDLKRGKPEISFNSYSAWISNNTGETSAGMITISSINLLRSDANSTSFETFAINESDADEQKFLFYDDDYKFKIVAVNNYAFYYGYTPFFPVGTNFAIRWHGAGNGISGSGHKCILNPDPNPTASCGQSHYSRYLSSNGFWSISCSGYLHTICWGYGSSGYRLDYSARTEMTKSENKIKYVMDRAATPSQLWGHFDVDHPETTSVYADETLVNYNNTSDMVKTFPSDANVVDNGSYFVYCACDPADYTRRVTRQINGLTWVKNGYYASDTEPTDSYRNWEEPGILLSKQNPKTMTHSATSKNILQTYDKYGWTGKLTEGLPIGLIEKSGTISFQLDTTNLVDDVIFAIATSPEYFQNLSSTQLLKDAPKPAAVTKFMIDNVELTSGAKKISAANHKFEIRVDAPDEAVPLFFKIEYDDSISSPKRKSITLPTEYTFVTKE